MVNYNSKDLVWILTKIDTDNRLWTPYKYTFSWTGVRFCQVTASFSSVWKDEEKRMKKKLENLLTHILEMLHTIFFKFSM